MAVYRFRVTFEDNEEVYREIEIKSSQNFEDFHNVIIQSIDFDNVHDASFFISDDYWRKGNEIVLRPSKDDGKVSTNTLVRQMNKCKMASLIDDPHQKFVYVYDPKVSWTFLVELIKIVPDDVKSTYPKCAKSTGIAPKQYKTSLIVPSVLDDEDLDEAEPHSDDDAYILAHSEEDTAQLEAEEGEIETGEEESVEDSDEFDTSELEDQTEGSFEED